MTGTPRPKGRIVEAGNFPTRYEADVAITLLRENDIEAMGKNGDADGWAPHFALVDGYRVMVFDDDLDAAHALLRAAALAEGDPDPDAGPAAR
ncbi:MAG: hypothetical protein FJW88_02465 [Actinobacteria bacterium]|nr:hypothetical protein [Actinomycetota bacterium]